MNKPKDFDKVQAYEERRKLPAGGYVCEIKKAEETKSKTGKDMVKLAIDICEGEYKGYFFDEFNRAKGFQADAKWPYEGTVWQLTLDRDGNTHRMFKALITSIEAENVRISWDDNFAKSIQGAQIGVIFGEEENENKNTGFVYWRTVPKYFCACEDVRTNNFRVPKPKPLEKVDLSWTNPAPADSFAAAEVDIPF